MNTLNAAQRRLLENTVTDARQLAEKGAVKALQNLAADQPEPFAHMSPGQRELRRRLRAKARLLGDENTNGKQQIENLSYELAYEYWHKMLFARFPEANNLLMHPMHGVAVSLDECAEFAAEEGYGDKWTAAAAYASHMLPAIFRPDDPLMQVEFATEDRIALERLLEGIGNDIYTATDSLGWVYQFWQSKAKADINASGDKIDGKRLPAVTQLFTEPYMVNFLIDNTLGAWWVSRNHGNKSPVGFDYLRMNTKGTSTSSVPAPQPTPAAAELVEAEPVEAAAGKFEGWPDKTAAITCLDPCMGSGHFVVELFLKMAPLRMFEEGLSREEATCRVIAENLHGLEIDPRCTQIAAFNLALTAWKFCGHYLELPEMNLACSGLAPKGKVEDWVKLVGKVNRFEDKERMENGMRTLYDHFQLAPELGSLLDPSTIKADLHTASFEELQPALLKALENEEDKDLVERGVMAAGIAKAGKLLAKKYTLQITNVPYLSRGKQDEVMAKFCAKHYPEAKGDLATVFFEKMLKTSTGTACSVIPQNWLFLTTYKQLREKLLKNRTWSIVARLGAKGFQTPMWDFNVMLIAIHNAKPTPESHFTGLDVSEKHNATAKDEALKTAELKTVKQADQLGNPDAVVALDEINSESLLNTVSYSHHGLTSGDLPRMRLYIWELNKVNSEWIPFQTTTKNTQYYGGLEAILRWQNGEGAINDLPGARKDGTAAWGKTGVIISQIGEMPASLYMGYAFDNNTAVITPNSFDYLDAIWSFCSSKEYHKAVRKIDQSLAVTSATMAKIPFNYEYWQKVAAEKYPNGLPKPYSDDPTQWLFHGHPQHAVNPLQVALARVMGYRWPAETDEEMELDEKARLHIAQIKAFDYLTDDDGIMCIPPVNGERPAAEVLRDYIRAVWGEAFGHQTLQELLQKEGTTATGLEQWLRNEFFAMHCKVFQNRPFIWHIWDGHKEGFSVLVNYHKLSRANLQKLIYTYLNDWIRHCERKQKDNESGADGLLMAARQLKTKLELILEGEPPYDIFVRWKPLHQQPIGWEPDLNDGVRLNIYPFIQAGILRKNPNIKWQKDRGKNPAGAPWGPDRYNRYEDLDDACKLKDENGRIVERLGNVVKRGAREKATNL